MAKNLRDELDEAAKDLQKKQKKALEKLKKENLEQFVIKGSEEDWSEVLKGKKKKNLISVKT